MSETLVVKAKNEETLLPRVLRVLAQQGLGVKDLRMSTSKDAKEMELRITLFSECAEQAVRFCPSRRQSWRCLWAILTKKSDLTETGKETDR